jgi:hypothetical protein
MRLVQMLEHVDYEVESSRWQIRRQKITDRNRTAAGPAGDLSG